MTATTIEFAETEISEHNRFQVMPPLSDEDFEALKADIQARGVLIPVEYDEAGNLLDGHHRFRACKELGIECPGKVRDGLQSEAEKRRHAITLNVKRRHLTTEQKRDLIAAQIIDAPERSARSIASDLKVDHKTVVAVREGMTATGEIPQLEKTVGKDGKARPAGKPKVNGPPPRAASPNPSRPVADRPGRFAASLEELAAFGRHDFESWLAKGPDCQQSIRKAGQYADSAIAMVRRFQEITLRQKRDCRTSDAPGLGQRLVAAASGYVEVLQEASHASDQAGLLAGLNKEELASLRALRSRIAEIDQAMSIGL